MTEWAFPGEHLCEVCSLWVHEHGHECMIDEDDRYSLGHKHFPALCCPGCRCGSFAEAHPEWVDETDRVH